MTQPVSAPAQAAPDIAALIREAVREATAPLQAQISTLQATQPKFVKLPPTRQPSRRSYQPPEELRVQALKLHRGESATGQTRWYDTAMGRDSLPEEYRPIFRPGDIVRLNPETVAWSDTRTWGEILGTRKTNPLGIGEVICTMGRTDSWEFKYKVSIPGESSGSGNGYRESELLFYEDEQVAV